MLDQNKAIARRLFDECWNRGQLDQIDDIFAKDCRYHDAAFPSLAPGPDAMRNHIRMCRNAFPDLKFTLDDTIAERDEVVVHWTANGTHQGQFLGVPATNRRASVSGTSICRLRNNKIVEQWSDWNVLTLLEQLGAAPKVSVSAR